MEQNVADDKDYKEEIEKYETVALIKDRSFGRTDLIKTRREQK